MADQHDDEDAGKLALQRKPWGHDFGKVPAHMSGQAPSQPRLTISQPGDRYEREADRVADAVMRMPKLHNQGQPGLDEEKAVGEGLSVAPHSVVGHISTLVQRELGVEEDKDVDELVQPEVESGMPITAPTLEEDISSLRAGGQPLDSTTRSFFEPRFGHDFSQVRIHADSKDCWPMSLPTWRSSGPA
jgi:hypothetical protein